MPLIKNEDYFKEMLSDEYFEMLEENGVDYIEYDKVSNDPPHTLTSVKEQYQVSDDEMAQELGFENYQDWKKDAMSEKPEIPGFEGTRESLNNLSIIGGKNDK